MSYILSVKRFELYGFSAIQNKYYYYYYYFQVFLHFLTSHSTQGGSFSMFSVRTSIIIMNKFEDSGLILDAIPPLLGNVQFHLSV